MMALSSGDASRLGMNDTAGLCRHASSVRTFCYSCKGVVPLAFSG